jgi:CBS domain containing-hemolysin-like protein
MSEHLGLYWATLVVCIVVSAFFSASETALVSLGKVRLRRLKERHPHLGPVIEQLTRNPDRLLSTVLFGSNLTNSAASAAATAIAMALFPAHPVLVATGAVTVLLLIFTDITPKVIAANKAEQISLLVAQPLNALSRIASPVVHLLTIGPRLFLRLFGITAGQPETTSDDIKTIAVLGREEGLLSDEEEDIIHSVVEFGDITVAQIMVPRVEIEGVDVGLPLDDVLDLVVETGHARIPVYQGSIDKVVGILYARDLLVAWRNRRLIILKDLLRPPLFVSGHMKVRDLFRELRVRNQRLAVVVDEYGGTAGIVTLDDVIAEIVGEVVDEHRQARAITPRKDGSLLVSGQIAIDELNEQAGLALPEEQFQTLSGLIVDHLGRVPYPGEEVTLPGASFHVLDADHRRIYKLSLRKT